MPDDLPQVLAEEPTVDDAPPVVHTRACPSCGCPVESPDQYCGACGAEQPVDAELADQPVEAEIVQRHFRCENCGAEVGVDLNQRSYICAFCDSTYVVEFTPEETGRQRPEFVIGFAITYDEALEKFRRWLRQNTWFRPGDLASAKIEDKLRGVYLPFWSFSMLAESQWSTNIGEYWYRTETYTTRQNGKTVTKTRQVRETEWWDLTGRHHRYYSGYLVSGSRGLNQAEAERIKPFHLPALKRYRPYFLAGWLSEEYSVERDDALEICKQEFYRREQQNVAAHLPGDTYRGLQVRTWFNDTNSDLILLPIYLLSYRYKDKVYRYLLNGQTGREDGDKPISPWRIGSAVGAVALVIGLIVLLLVLFQ